MKDKKALAKNYADMAKKSTRNMGDCNMAFIVSMEDK